MNFFINNIPNKTSSLIGFDLPKSVKLAKTKITELTRNKAIMTRIQSIEQELIRSARMSIKYY